MKLYFSDDAFEQLINLQTYLTQRWSIKVSENFLDKVFLNIDIIEQNPFSFPPAPSFPGLRKCVITPQTIAYYRVKEAINEVEIIVIIDARQDF